MKYRTTLKCAGCVSKIEPILAAYPQVKSWGVDLKMKEKILNLEGESIPFDQIEEQIKSLGFELDPIKE